MKNIVKIFLCLLLLCGCVSKVTQDQVLNHATQTLQIDEAWKCVESQNEEIVALLFYSEDSQEHLYAIYVKDDSESFVLEESGVITGEREMITIGGYRIFISLNSTKACRYEIENLCKAQSTSLNSEEPFVLMILDEGEVFFYDKDGNRV